MQCDIWYCGNEDAYPGLSLKEMHRCQFILWVSQHVDQFSRALQQVAWQEVRTYVRREQPWIGLPHQVRPRSGWTIGVDERVVRGGTCECSVQTRVDHLVMVMVVVVMVMVLVVEVVVMVVVVVVVVIMKLNKDGDEDEEKSKIKRNWLCRTYVAVSCACMKYHMSKK
jgi:hypothetical protein